MTTIAACPFCNVPGQESSHENHSEGDCQTIWHVGCENKACAVRPVCHAAGPHGYKYPGEGTNEEAKARALVGWNRRAPLSEFITGNIDTMENAADLLDQLGHNSKGNR